MLRKTMLILAQNQALARFSSQHELTRRLAGRFVAGDTFQQAAEVIQRLNAQGMKATIDALGENVGSEAEAEAASREYCRILDGIRAQGLDSTISIKLTMLGLDLSDDLCRQNLRPILERARELNQFVRIDMEGSPYTQRTLDIFYAMHTEFGDHVGIVLQSYLYRTEEDVRKAIERRARVRLVKGAYAEPESIAYPGKREVDAAFRRQMEALLEHGNHLAIATHDETILTIALGFTQRLGIDNSRFELQMLYGIRRDLQEKFTSQGHTVRVYVPYGTRWYPYFMRRLAERPANLLFVARNILRG